MDEKGALTLLGFAQKGRMLVAGESGVDVFLKKDKLQLMIIASDLAAERQTSWQQKAAENEIETIIFSTKSQLGLAIGMSPRSVIGITDAQMAQALLKKLL